MRNVLIAIDEFATSSNLPLKILEKAGFNVFFNEKRRPLNLTSDSDMYENMDYVIAGLEPYTDIFFKRFGRVKAISRVGVGVDCVDLESASEHSVKIFVTSDRPSVAVAELCVSNMISLLRHTFRMSNDLKSNIWNPLQGKELRSCVVGVIGMGSIGKEVTKRVCAFGAEVVGYSRTWNENFANFYDVKRYNLKEIFKHADIITIHLPLSPETKGMINAELIGMIRRNAIILNTSRAGVIDNNALAQSILQNRIAGAAVDVFDEERDPYPYGSLDNVILTPHIGSHTVETRKSMEEMAAQSLVIYDSWLAESTDQTLNKYVDKHSVS